MEDLRTKAAGTPWTKRRNCSPPQVLTSKHPTNEPGTDTADGAGRGRDTRYRLRFTASTFGALMVQPRNKADREAGSSNHGTGLDPAKAIERLTGTWMSDGESSFSMRRGLLHGTGRSAHPEQALM